MDIKTYLAAEHRYARALEMNAQAQEFLRNSAGLEVEFYPQLKGARVTNRTD